MSSQLLELHYAQLSKAWNKSKYNKYSDEPKSDYHKSLQTLISKIDQEDFTKLNAIEISQRSNAITFVFKSLEFLDWSTYNLIPFEIVKCLESALNDWLLPGENHIIVTSLVNGINRFSFDPSLATNDNIYNNVKLLYDVSFNSKLIQINVPNYLSRDYLANVALYHELGHFVDIKYQITNTLYNEILEGIFDKKIIAGKDLDDLEYFFPFIKQPMIGLYYKNNANFEIFYSYLEEYFCDVFASQYISDSLNHYLSYITQMADFSESHPATKQRVEIVNKFLTKDPTCFLLNKMNEVVRKILAGKELNLKYEKINSDDFINLVPIEVTNVKQLHYLFIHGWNLWLNDWHLFEKNNNMNFKLDGEKVYDIINSLIEKSIGNYVVKTNWEKAKANVFI